jgi:uncharacterized protein (TIGR02145 family)
MKKHILILILFLFLAPTLYSQAPQSIPYQAVVRNTDGSMMAEAAMTITFKIHDNTATGTVVYEENHTATTNAQGLISLNVGNGVVVSGTFSGINWGSGSKFLHVLMNAGSGVVDLGTQQMMSVPYALYAEKANTTNVSVSAVGDTLYLGNGNFILVPGISGSNKIVDTGLGNVLLPGVPYCADKLISASGCDGMTTLDYQGYTYDLVEIAGQCWFKENLRATSFNDGTPITYEPNSQVWNSPTGDIAEQPYYAFYDNELINQSNYGNLYNAFCLVNENICPIGWHIPKVCDIYYLLSTQGVSNSELILMGSGAGGNNGQYPGIDNLAAHKLLMNEQISNSIQGPVRIIPNNSSGFSAKTGGMRYASMDGGKNYSFDFWGMTHSSAPLAATDFSFSLEVPGMISMGQNLGGIDIQNSGQSADPQLFQGRSIRCIKD